MVALENHITKIQSQWRGYRIRKKIELPHFKNIQPTQTPTEIEVYEVQSSSYDSDPRKLPIKN